MKNIINTKMVLKVKGKVITPETLSPGEYADRNLVLYACATCFAIVHSEDRYCWYCATDISKGTTFSSDGLSTEYKDAFKKEVQV